MNLHEILSGNWKSSRTEALFPEEPIPQMLIDILPADYLDAVREFGGREGFLGTEYLRLHRLDELLSLNTAYGVPTAVPEIVIFGSDGALEAFAFMLEESVVVKVPFIPLLLENAFIVGRSFSDFISSLHSTGPALEIDPNTLGMQIHCKHPIALGGSPTDLDNRVNVPPQKHAELARYWNKVYNHARSQSENDA